MARDRGARELAEKRLRTGGTALELGVCLRGNEPGMLGGRQLHHLDERLVGRDAGDDEPRALKVVAVGVVEFEAVAVALVHKLLAIRLTRERACAELRGIRAQAHGSALLGHALPASS